MNCITENRIESIVLGGAPATEPEQDHLFLCDRCRDVFLALAAIHPTSNRALQIRLFGETAPFEPGAGMEAVLLRPAAPWVYPDLSSYRLAALGGQPVDPFLLYSFHSADQDILARVLQDRDSGQVRLYLVAERQEAVQGLKVILDGCGLEGITDLTGCIDFGVHGDLTIESIRIPPPAAVFLVASIEEKFEDGGKHYFVISNADREEVMIELERGEPKTRYLIRSSKKTVPGEAVTLQVVAITDRRTLTGFPEQGVTILDTEGQEKVLKIHIY